MRQDRFNFVPIVLIQPMGSLVGHTDVQSTARDMAGTPAAAAAPKTTAATAAVTTTAAVVLHVDLEREVPEAMKPRKISITRSESGTLLEQEAA